jgi:hypothetical protein
MMLIGTAIYENVSKTFDILIMVVFPEKAVHGLVGWQTGIPSVTSKEHLAVTSWDTAFLKVYMKRREISKGRKGSWRIHREPQADDRGIWGDSFDRLLKC